MLRHLNVNVVNNTPKNTPIGSSKKQQQLLSTAKQSVTRRILFDDVEESCSPGDEQQSLKKQQVKSESQKTTATDGAAKLKENKIQPELGTGTTTKQQTKPRAKKVFPMDPDMRFTYTGWTKDCYEGTIIRQMEEAPFVPLEDDYPKRPEGMEQFNIFELSDNEENDEKESGQ